MRSLAALIQRRNLREKKRGDKTQRISPKVNIIISIKKHLQKDVKKNLETNISKLRLRCRKYSIHYKWQKTAEDFP